MALWISGSEMKALSVCASYEIRRANVNHCVYMKQSQWHTPFIWSCLTDIHYSVQCQMSW